MQDDWTKRWFPITARGLIFFLIAGFFLPARTAKTATVVQVFEVDDLTQPGGAAEADLDALISDALESNIPESSQNGHGVVGEATMPKPLAPGRYRAIFELSATPFSVGPVLNCEVRVNAQSFRTRLGPFDFPSTAFISPGVNFQVQPGDAARISMKVEWQNWQERGQDIRSVRLRRIRVERLTGPVFLTRIRADRLFYTPGQKGLVSGRVTNGGTKDIVATLVLDEQVRLDAPRELARRPLTVPTGKTVEFKLPCQMEPVHFGRTLRVTLKNSDRILDTATDQVVVETPARFWDVALGAVNNGILHSTGRYGPKPDQIIAGQIKRMRQNYSNWLEIDFWAPDDWGNLTPKTEQWVSGQAARWQRKSVLKKLIAAAHTQGIRAITYGKGMAGGPSAWELLRESPWLFQRSSKTGRWGGNPDLWDFEHWNDPELHLREAKKFTTVWHRLAPNLADERALAHGINELIGSARMFGWDGVRFDGQFSAVNDTLSTWNMRQTKQRLWKAQPHFLFGFNLCNVFDYSNPFPHELREAMIGGGMWMQEAIGHWGYQADRRYRGWRQYAIHEQLAAERVQQAGGSYHYIYRLDTCPNDLIRYYKFVIGTLNGAHPCYGAQTMAPGCPNWGRFLTRWGGLFWQSNRRTPDQLRIAVSNLPKSVLWRHWSKIVPVSATRKLLVLSFLNLPTVDEIAQTRFRPPSVRGGQVDFSAFKKGEIQQLAWLTPMSVQPRMLPTGKNRIQLPPLDPLGILLVEYKTRKSAESANLSMARFTEPVDPAAVKKSRESENHLRIVDPLRPELNQVETDDRIEIQQCEKHSWSMHRAVFDDPQAAGGQAAGGDMKLRGFCTGAYFWELPPGRYRISARIKVTGTIPGGFEWRLYENIKGPNNLYRARGGAAGILRKSYRYSEFKRDKNQYVECTFPKTFEQYGLGFLTIFLQGTIPETASTDARFMVDWVKAERLATYNDGDLAKKLNLQPPVGLTPGPPSSVLWIRGLDDSLYQLDTILKQTNPASRVVQKYQRDFNGTIRQLQPFGVVILPNVPLGGWGVKARRNLADWVRAGGHLVILGGSLSLGQGGLKGTFIDDLLPCDLLQAADVEKLPGGRQVTVSRTGVSDLVAGTNCGVIYYAHRVRARENSKILLKTGALPLLMTRPVDKGRCSVFAGTVLGAPQSAPTAFWNNRNWPVALGAILKLR